MDAFNQPNGQHSGKVITGVILLSLGIILLISQFSFFFIPGWLFSWPMILIVIGLLTGAKHNFRNATSLVLIAIGVVFLLNRIFFIGHVLWPLVFIAIGASMIMRRSQRFN